VGAGRRREVEVDPSETGEFPSLADVGGVPDAAWGERSETSIDDMRVKRLEPDFLSQSAVPTLTGATLSAQIDDFGVPLPVGFEYGTASCATTPLRGHPASIGCG
jgi:hypothetical protein